MSDILKGLFPDLATVPDPITPDEGTSGSVPEPQQPSPRQQSLLASVPRGRLIVRSPRNTRFGADRLPLPIPLPPPDPLDADFVVANVAASSLHQQLPRRHLPLPPLPPLPLGADSSSAPAAVSALPQQLPRQLPLPLPPPPPLPLGADSASAPVASSALQQQLPRRLPLPLPRPPSLPLGADSAWTPVATSALPQQLARRLPLPLSPPPLIPSDPPRNVRLRIPLEEVSRVILRLPLKARAPDQSRRRHLLFLCRPGQPDRLIRCFRHLEQFRHLFRWFSPMEQPVATSRTFLPRLAIEADLLTFG